MSEQKVFRKGITLSLGIASAQVDVFTAVEKEASNHKVCTGSADKPHTATQVRQRTACPECDNDDASTFELVAAGDEGAAILTQDERNQAKKEAMGTSDKSVELTIHHAEEVGLQTIPSGGVYWLRNHAGTTTGLDHIIDMLKRNPEYVVLGTWSPAGVPNTYQFRAFGDTLVMQQMADPAMVRVQQQETGVLSEALQGLMDQCLATMVTTFNPEAYRNQFAAKMREIVAAKPVEENVVLTAKAKGKPVQAAEVVDFAAALAAQLAAAKPAKKTAAKRAAKKAA